MGMGNRQEGLETIVQQEDHDIAAITEMWLDNLFTALRIYGWESGKDNEMDILVAVSHKPLNHNEETDEMFYQQLREASP